MISRKEVVEQMDSIKEKLYDNGCYTRKIDDLSEINYHIVVDKFYTLNFYFEDDKLYNANLWSSELDDDYFRYDVKILDVRINDDIQLSKIVNKIVDLTTPEQIEVIDINHCLVCEQELVLSQRYRSCKNECCKISHNKSKPSIIFHVFEETFYNNNYDKLDHFTNSIRHKVNYYKSNDRYISKIMTK